MSYNVENLFDMVDDGTEYPEYRPNTHGWNDYALGVKLHNIASVLAASRADIAGLVELENQSALELLRREAGLLGLDYGYAVTARKAPGAAVTVGLLSRFPILSQRSQETVSTAGGYASRCILEARVLVGQDTLIVFVNHWPSRAHAESYRIGAARALVERLRQLPAGADYLIIGDLNENVNEAEVVAGTKRDDADGVAAINHVLGTARSGPHGPLDCVLETGLADCAGMCHYDAWLELPVQDRWSYVYRGEMSSLDHIVLPPSLYDSRGISYEDNSFAVFTDSGRLLKNGVPRRWAMTYTGPVGEHVGEGYSDHLPLTARFYHGAFKRAAAASASARPGPRPMPRTGGFESGLEGWICQAESISLATDTLRPYTGSHSLRVCGTTGARNMTIARSVIYPPTSLPTGPRIVSLRLRGTGPLCFRTRARGGKKWRYFAPPSFAPSGSARYAPFTSADWAAIRLCGAGGAGSEGGLELELRAGKASEVRVWIDDVRVE